MGGRRRRGARPGVGVHVGLDLGFVVDPTAIVPFWMPDENERILGPATVLVPPGDGVQLSTSAIKHGDPRARRP